MTSKLNIILLAAAVTLGGCNRDQGKTPTGQVVATVEGQEVTLEQLRAETGELPAEIDAGMRKMAERAALQQILARTIIADYAEQQKLDQTPLAAILKQRAEQDAKVGLVQRKLTSDVPPPSRDEVDLFIRDHPSSFAQRRIFIVDQISALGVPPAVQKTLESFDTLAQVRSAYDRAGVRYNQTVGTIDALAVNADAAEKLAALPVGTMFISPEGGMVRVNLIRNVEVAPVTGEDAARIARDAIRGARERELTQRQLAGIVQQGMAKVRYNAAYQPPAPNKGAAAQRK